MADSIVNLPAVISVKDLADKLQLPVPKLIAILIKNGIMATINESLDFDIAAIVAQEFGFEAVLDVRKTDTRVQASDEKDLVYRAPVVTIMGHVDHGKTTLLDTIRKTDVAGGESGGITQHIAAYQVKAQTKSKHNTDTITFLDTPGHAAFTALRQHGANITDIVVLVVAANDGIKAQTIEAIDHAKQAHVPIIVAITKVDLPDANIERIKQQLAEFDMVPEEWGGKTIIVPVSAKAKTGIDELLEMILLVSDLAELKATTTGKAYGVVVESHLEPGKGPVATILVQNGNLHVGDPIAIGHTTGKVRTLQDYRGSKLAEAGPSTPVIISGLKAIPHFAETLAAFETEREARESSARSSSDRAATKVHTLGTQGLENSVSDESIEQHELPLVIKADVKGSLEAVRKVLEDISTTEAHIKITQEGVGAVAESDITHAKATKSALLAFRVPVAPAIRNLANQEKVSISSYDVIYDLVEDAKKALSKLLPPEIVEVPLGTAKVIALFKGDKRTHVVGVQIEEGVIEKNTTFHLIRKKDIVGDGVVVNIRRGKEEVKTVESGQQAGLSLPGTLNYAEGDIIQTYRTETHARTL